MNAISFLIAGFILEVEGNNLLLNKPSILAASGFHFVSQKPTDGDPLTFDHISSDQWSYWQGDLQGSYPVQSVVVSLLISQGESNQSTSIGVSNSDRNANLGAEFFECGEWPDGVNGTAVFTCNPPHLVRYVVIKRSSPGSLYVAEVEVPDTRTQSLAELNLMLNKKSTHPSTFNGGSTYEARNANDGDPSTVSMTSNEINPYWQGDLQGDFLIQSIAVTMVAAGAAATHLRNAYIGISGQGSEPIVCGQWPDLVRDMTLLFRCEHSRAVRFVRIWREGYVRLAVAEVVVQETYAELSEMTMSLMESKKVSTVRKSLRTDTSTECSNECFRKQPCSAFSFNKMAGLEENCLLSADTTVMSDSNWVSYKMESRSFCPKHGNL